MYDPTFLERSWKFFLGTRTGAHFRVPGLDLPEMNIIIAQISFENSITVRFREIFIKNLHQKCVPKKRSTPSDDENIISYNRPLTYTKSYSLGCACLLVHSAIQDRA